MQDPHLIWAGALVLVTAMVCCTSLAAWRSWLYHRDPAIDPRNPRAKKVGPTGSRIEMADVKERLRKLEAIATGVDP